MKTAIVTVTIILRTRTARQLQFAIDTIENQIPDTILENMVLRDDLGPELYPGIEAEAAFSIRRQPPFPPTA